MKKMSLLISMILSLSMPMVANASGFTDSVGNYLQKYGIPCVVGMAAGYVVDRGRGVGVGAVGCAIVISYGEFGRGSNRTLTDDDVKLVQGLIDQKQAQSNQAYRQELNEKINLVNHRIDDSNDQSRQNIRNAVTDLGVFMEKDLGDKLDKKQQNPDLLKRVGEEISLKVKQEVENEFRVRQRSLVEQTANSVIKRVTAEPIVLDDDQAKKPPQKK